jgi:hypothetical protein
MMNVEFGSGKKIFGKLFFFLSPENLKFVS